MNVINITSLSAYKLLKNNNNSCIIDVRTKDEQIKNGVPKIDNQLYCIAWRLTPEMKINGSFQEEFLGYMKNIDIKQDLFFICRSGGRSYEAADFIAKTGIMNCYNIVDGFDGGTWGVGWKLNNLPWQIVA